MIAKNRARLLASVCALGLAATGLAACNNADQTAKEAATSASTAAESAASKASEAATDASKAAKEGASEAKEAASTAASKASEAASEATEAAKDAAADAKIATGDDMVKVKDAAGTEIAVPAAIANTYRMIDGVDGFAGKLVNVTHKDDRWVASYDNGWHIAYSKETGAHVVKGLIGQFWFENGALEHEAGLPINDEQPDRVNGGWTQDFANGTIWAKENGDAGFTAR